MCCRADERNRMTIQPEEFLDLVDAVLVAAGRSPLFPTSPEKRIIRIEDDDQVLQILAGPGSGKTEMLCWRVLFDILVRGTDASRILVTTFTRKASEEMTIRIAQRSESMIVAGKVKGITVPDPKIHNLRIGTLHSLCDQLLTEFHDFYREQDFRIVEELEARLHMNRWWWQTSGGKKNRDRFRDLITNYPEIVDLRRPQQLPAQLRTSWPAQMPDQLGLVSDLLGHQVETWWPRNETSPILNAAVPPARQKGLTDAIAELQSSWQNFLFDPKRNLIDFAIIQQQFAEVQEDFMLNAVDHVLVDEFQDTNPVQYLIHFQWVLPTAKRDESLPKMRLTVVGDDDQSIYRFRGSDIACFMGLKGDCNSHGIPFREEVIPYNNRSSQEIVNFSSAYRTGAIPPTCSLPKTITTHNPPKGPVRLAEGPWAACCELIATEATTHGYGKGMVPTASMALLLFSSSEKESSNYAYPATRLRDVLEAKGIPVDNTRNKIAGKPGSPVHTIVALLSYLIDPVENGKNPATGRTVFCWATSDYGTQARSKAPGFFVPPDYSSLQKQFFKEHCNQVGLAASATDPKLQMLLDYLNKIRSDLVTAVDAANAVHAKGHTAKYPKLTLAGLVARLLTFPYFRDAGYTTALFRQSLLTEIVEAIIAPSRMSGASLEDPLKAWTDGGQICWPDEIWSFIGALGQIVAKTSLDDPEVEAFAENAFRMLTFHQSKGLEFDEVYVAGTGRAISFGSVITTRAFSGQTSSFTASGGVISTTDSTIQDLAQADAAREVYVAITRPKKKLTILHDPGDGGGFMGLDPALEKLFEKKPAIPHPTIPGLTIKEVSL